METNHQGDPEQSGSLQNPLSTGTAAEVKAFDTMPTTSSNSTDESSLKALSSAESVSHYPSWHNFAQASPPIILGTVEEPFEQASGQDSALLSPTAEPAHIVPALVASSPMTATPIPGDLGDTCRSQTQTSPRLLATAMNDMHLNGNCQATYEPESSILNESRWDNPAPRKYTIARHQIGKDQSIPSEPRTSVFDGYEVDDDGYGKIVDIQTIDRSHYVQSAFVAPHNAGDLYIVVGTGNQTMVLEVNSGAMKVASPVFAAMFNHDFSERGKISANPTTRGAIDLPDDDPMAMLRLIEIIHLHKVTVPKMSIPEIESLGIICDKYQCIGAVKPFIQHWVGAEEFRGGFVSAVRRTCVAYAYDDHIEFAAASLSVLFEVAEDELLRPCSTMVEDYNFDILLAILPEDLLLSINDQRMKIIREIHLKLEQTIQPFLADRGPCSLRKGVAPSRAHAACDKAKMLLHVLEQLEYLHLWPLSSLDLTTSLTNFTRLLALYDNHDQIWEQHACECVEYDFVQAFKEIVDKYNNDVKGLCLNCVKEGRFTKEGGNCVGQSECLGEVAGNQEAEGENFPMRYFVPKLGGGWKDTGARSGIRGGRGYFGNSRIRGRGRGRGQPCPTFVAGQGYLDEGRGYDTGGWSNIYPVDDGTEDGGGGWGMWQ